MSIFNEFGRVKRSHILSQRGRNFLQAPWAGGIVLIVCVIIAMILANMPGTHQAYHDFLQMPFGLAVGNDIFPRGMTVETFINDGLMVIFFFTVGLEIRREISHGQLSTPKKAILPVMGALGGMIVPALIYMSINGGTIVTDGWGIPTATDIAFAIAIMSLFGNRVPLSLKVFLTALAVADDLGAILVIAIFYGHTPNMLLLGIAIAIMVGIYFMRRMGEFRIIAYLVPAVVVWILCYYSGVHATISGVAMAMLIPTKPRYSRSYYLHKADIIEKGIKDADKIENEYEADEERMYYLRRMKQISNGAYGMSHRMEHLLMPYVNFIIMPIFALANAGVHISSAEYFNIFTYSPEVGSIGMGIFFGLVVGKPLGITLFSYIAIKLGIAEKPSGVTTKMFMAVACLGGIGFTMSIFVNNLAFQDPALRMYVDMGKIAILMASLTAAVVGSILIVLEAKKEKKLK